MLCTLLPILYLSVTCHTPKWPPHGNRRRAPGVIRQGFNGYGTTSVVTHKCPNISVLGQMNCLSCVDNELISSSLSNTELKSIFNSQAIKIPVLLYSQHYHPVVGATLYRTLCLLLAYAQQLYRLILYVVSIYTHNLDCLRLFTSSDVITSRN